ncbi:MAG: lyase family protein, partial [Microterricola sp.]
MTERSDGEWGLLEPLAASSAVIGDDAVLAAMVEVERALLLAWGRESGADVGAAAGALRAEELDCAGLLAGSRSDGMPVVALVRQLRALAEAASPGAGAELHVGATSQDILDTALVLTARRALTEARLRLLAAGERLVALATAEAQTLAIARTLGQHAEQSTAGVLAAGWLDGVSSAVAAIDAAVFPVQLGGAVGTGEAIDRAGGSVESSTRLRAALAAELGLADPGRSWHSERSPILTIGNAAAIVAVTLGRLGRDVGFLSRSEVAEVVLATAGGSSAMPHKRNPIDAVLLSANGLRVGGLQAVLHGAAISQDARPMGEWHAEWSAFRG